MFIIYIHPANLRFDITLLPTVLIIETIDVSEDTTKFYEEITKEIKKEEDVKEVKLSKCRADDTVRCSDESRYICSVQKCDGVKDCDDGDDEVGCPHPGIGYLTLMMLAHNCIFVHRIVYKIEFLLHVKYFFFLRILCFQKKLIIILVIRKL